MLHKGRKGHSRARASPRSTIGDIENALVTSPRSTGWANRASVAPAICFLIGFTPASAENHLEGLYVALFDRDVCARPPPVAPISESSGPTNLVKGTQNIMVPIQGRTVSTREACLGPHLTDTQTRYFVDQIACL